MTRSPGGHDEGTGNTGISAEEFCPRPLESQPTWIREQPSQTIHDFVKDYAREHYEELAKAAKALIDRKLADKRDSNEEEVQAKVTCRAKDQRSLEEKLKMRNEERKQAHEKEYQTADDIRDDIKDLAGVRVVLYTPNEAQRNKVREVIRDIWGWGPEVEEIHHNGSNLSATNNTKSTYVRKHLDYQAVHYRTPMKEDQGTGTYSWKSYDKVEIQVVSALAHAWAEAGHDVLYKTHAYGRPSVQEHRILDALSGLIVSGDLLLEQFRELVTKRTYAKWKQPEQFAIFLEDVDVLERPPGPDGQDTEGYQKDFAQDGRDILFRFLEKTANNYPLAVRNTLRDLGYPQNPEAGLNEELQRFTPSFKPPEGLLTPLCIISRLFPKDKVKGKELVEKHDISKRCSIMMDALILLQTFAGSPDDAKTLLSDSRVSMTNAETESLNFVLDSLNRRDCLLEFGKLHLKHWEDDLRRAWSWFQQQAADDGSLCGLLFRLTAQIGVSVTKETSDHERMSKLKIGSLSRTNTPEEDDEEGGYQSGISDDD